LSCRTGPLRVVRPLRGAYTRLEEIIFFGPTVGREINDPGQRPGRCGLFHPDKLKRRANARPTRSGPVRQDICSLSKRNGPAELDSAGPLHFSNCLRQYFNDRLVDRVLGDKADDLLRNLAILEDE
jgi:hypothetical protein